MIDRRWLIRWMPLITGVMGAQVLTQGLNALSGIILVRMLPRESAYAWFTVASSMMAVISLLSDAGTGVAANAIGGPVWHQREKFSQIIAAIMRYRRWLAGIAIVVATPWTVALLVRIKAPAWDIALVILVIMVSAWPATSAQIYGSVNRLHSRYRPQLLANMAAALARLILTAACVLPVFLLFGTLVLDLSSPEYPANYCFISVVIAACLPSFLSNQMLKKDAKKILMTDVPVTREFDARIRETLRHTYPNALFYCLQAQMGTWLISLFGATSQVADIGALSRMGIIFSVATAPVFQIAGPAFARCVDRRSLLKQFGKVCSLYAVFGFGVLLAVTIAPEPFLWVLGPQYGHLGMELRLSVVALIVSGYSGITWELAMFRGWVRLLALSIPLGIMAQGFGLFLFNLSTVSGVLGFNIFTNVPSVLLACFIIWRGFSNWKENATTPDC